MEDHDILALYFSRSERAIEETAAKYQPFLFGLSYRILRSADDAEECVNDTYLRAWNAIPPDWPEAFRSWLGRVTRNLSLDRWNARRAAKRGGHTELLLGELEDCIPAPGGQEPDDRELADAIGTFLRTRSREARIFFLRRYYYGDGVNEIASAFGCTAGKVKSSLFRTREALRDYLTEQGVSL